jgi:hypothetical protein
MVVGVLAQTDVLVSMDLQEEDVKQVIVCRSEVICNLENITVKGQNRFEFLYHVDNI